MFRLFAALPVPTDIAEQLLPLQKGLNGASWRPLKNFHITLRFFGEVTRELAVDLDRDIAEIAAQPIQISLKGCGFFGKREPRSVWARVEDNTALTNLSNACERIARRHGLPAEKRAFRPHVTLAYCHGTLAEEAAAFEARHVLFASKVWTADRFHLYSSHLGRGPSRYTAEADYPMLNTCRKDGAAKVT